ncbi:MAG: glycosyl transferase family 4, partial [Candidatus Pacearchaeota archaeon]|nr:glycosyl transferase family 4 [Candidatus Pacearchaeota archaeon]
GLVWEDMNKIKSERVAGSGGIIVILGFTLGVLAYIFLKTFYFNDSVNVVEIFALTTSMLMLAFIGLIDDLLGWQHGGLSKRFRLLMCIFAAVPLVVINAGNSNVSIPFIDGTNLGLLYSLIFIPLGIVGASTTFNFLAGFNGLEAGQGVLIISALSIVAYFTGNSWLAMVGICMIVALLAFWIFNRVPAKVFPVDVMTYAIGGLIAIMAVLGNMEKIAIFFFVPYIFEVILKCRGRLKKYSFGKPNEDGSLEMPYERIYGLEHFSIWALKKIKSSGKAYENDVVYFIYFIQVLFIVAGFLMYWFKLF